MTRWLRDAILLGLAAVAGACIVFAVFWLDDWRATRRSRTWS